MNYLPRTIQSEIEKWLFKNKAIIIYGTRQVGKTTLVRQLMMGRENEALYLNCDQPDIRDALYNKTSTQLKEFIGNKTFIVIDEAQRVENIGITLKLIIDNYPEIQLIATGSSSFDLSNKIKEPLTGRKIEFTLYPFSVEELLSVESKMEFMRLFTGRLVFGTYPGVIRGDEKTTILRELSETYLYKDILNLQSVKSPELLRRLLQALALQIGSDVSYSELGSILGLAKETVMRYIFLLIQSHIIFELPPYRSNIRNTIGKQKKIYFCDLGIRNALINNFNPIELRNDVGGLWENYCIIERRKFNHNRMRFPNNYFWRAYDRAEIDYIEDINGSLSAFEFKWREERAHPPKAFFEVYPDTPFRLVNRFNFLDFLS